MHLSLIEVREEFTPQSLTPFEVLREGFVDKLFSPYCRTIYYPNILKAYG